jgi:hypothetical protein
MPERSSRRPTKIEVTSAHNLFEWIARYAESHPSQELDESELGELWTATDTALGVIEMGELGSRRLHDLLQAVDLARGSGGALDFGTAARYAGPVVARLASQLEHWPSGQPCRKPRRVTISAPVHRPEDTKRKGPAST